MNSHSFCRGRYGSNKTTEGRRRVRNTNQDRTSGRRRATDLRTDARASLVGGHERLAPDRPGHAQGGQRCRRCAHGDKEARRQEGSGRHRLWLGRAALAGPSSAGAETASRWRTFAEKSRDDLNKDDEELLYNTTAALQNLIWAGIHTELSGYKPSWSKSLKTVENLSGVSDTYLHLISFAVQRDLEKYLSEDISNVYTENLGWLIIYGALLQGGLVGLNAAMDEDLDFTSLLKPATAKWTEAPSGFKRPFQLSNIPDERWSKYPFWSSPEGFESKLTGFGDPTEPYAFTLNLGLNIASMADLYPEDEKEKEKYKGLKATRTSSSNTSGRRVRAARGKNHVAAGRLHRHEWLLHAAGRRTQHTARRHAC